MRSPGAATAGDLAAAHKVAGRGPPRGCPNAHRRATRTMGQTRRRAVNGPSCRWRMTFVFRGPRLHGSRFRSRQPLLTHGRRLGIEHVHIVHFSRRFPPLGCKGECGENRTDHPRPGGRRMGLGRGAGLGSAGPIRHARNDAAASGHARRAAAASPPAVTSPPSGAYAPPATSSPYPSPTPTQPSYPTPSMAAPTYPPPTAATPLYATPSPTVPSYPAPPAQPGTTYAAPTAPGPAPAFAPVPAYGTPPPAAFNGTIQPPPPTFDPYATPGVTPPAPSCSRTLISRGYLASAWARCRSSSSTSTWTTTGLPETATTNWASTTSI